MNTFRLKIVTPNGLKYDGSAERVVVRTTSGDVAIMARHINYVAPLGMGEATVKAQGNTRTAACIGGMVSVMDGEVTLLPMTFEWAEDIDQERAAASEERARSVIGDKSAGDTDVRMAEARLKRALIRQNVARHKPM